MAQKLTVRETLRLFGSFYERPQPVESLLAMVELESKADARVKTLSGGQRQRLGVACALAGDPELLFLDEPTTGLDPQSRRSLWGVIEAFLADGGTVLLTTHYMDEAAQLSHRIAIMDHGRVIARGTPDELTDRLGGDHVVAFTLERGASVPPSEFSTLPGVTSARVHEGRYTLLVTELHGAVPALLSRLAEGNLTLSGLTTHTATLEDVFLELTGRRLRDGQ